MNIHIGSDDKFLDYIIDISKKTSNTRLNKFFIITADNNKELKYIKSKEVEVINTHSIDFKLLLEGVTHQHYTHLYIHYLHPVLYKFINLVPSKVEIIWCFWGEDGFGRAKLRKLFLNPSTLKANNEHVISIIWQLLKLLRSPRRFYKYVNKLFSEFVEFRKTEKDYIKTVKRINWFAHYIYQDYLLIKSKYPLEAKYLNFSYASVEAIFDQKQSNKYVEGNNIVVGNSANYMNNHLLGFNYLKKVLLPSDAKIYCPLNYSHTSDTYFSNIIKEGRICFSDKFHPITEFISKEDYHKILYTCKFAIMPHYRSQAWGNIMALLWIGSSVFLSRKSSLYSLLKFEFDLIIFTIEDDLSKGVDLLKFELNESKILHNRQQLIKFVGEESKIKVIQGLLSV